ncbi:MAG: phosphoribosylanthranilate isomerase [Leptolyngbyaceae cyanobacterium bins.59]|nr:phosphoribosylanthranilate isomerase [Leptolyngbyaceae cyanobacterium bins.59]
MAKLRIKICGITKPDQGRAIVELGATALGFICVPSSPRYIDPQRIHEIVEQLSVRVDRIGVFANTTLSEICETARIAKLTGIQLHGSESPQFCHAVRDTLPEVELLKAFRVKSPETLEQIQAYTGHMDTLLLDAYHPQLLGGTGHTIDWSQLQKSDFPCPWFLAGGLTPDNVLQALALLQPDGIDLSSGVERSPGDKDLGKITDLFEQLRKGLENRRPKIEDQR